MRFESRERRPRVQGHVNFPPSNSWRDWAARTRCSAALSRRLERRGDLYRKPPPRGVETVDRWRAPTRASVSAALEKTPSPRSFLEESERLEKTRENLGEILSISSRRIAARPVVQAALGACAELGPLAHQSYVMTWKVARERARPEWRTWGLSWCRVSGWRKKTESSSRTGRKARWSECFFKKIRVEKTDVCAAVTTQERLATLSLSLETGDAIVSRRRHARG